MLALTFENTVETVVPRVAKIVTAAMATSAAIKAYSTMVTPLKSDFSFVRMRTDCSLHPKEETSDAFLTNGISLSPRPMRKRGTRGAARHQYWEVTCQSGSYSRDYIAVGITFDLCRVK